MEQSLIKAGMHGRLTSMQQFFNRSTEVLAEEDSEFSPVPGTYTVAQQVAHTAQMIDWCIEGAFAPHGFEMDFDRQDREIRQFRSLTRAREWLQRAFARAHGVVDLRSEVEWTQCFPPGAFMANQLKLNVMVLLTDHVAHHRGSLAVYSRLLGKVPFMPYAPRPT